jgi:hypothetical protein
LFEPGFNTGSIFNMEHFFNLPVLYHGEELELPGRLTTFGYVYKFHITVKGQEFVFEKDEGQHYRVMSEADEPGTPVETELLEAIIQSLQQLND